MKHPTQHQMNHARARMNRALHPQIEEIFARVQKESDARYEALLTPLRLQRCKLNERIAIATLQ